MNEIMLETKNLCKTFRKQSVVKNISLSVPKYSIYGLLGPNGAGKSTTLKMITGMLTPTSGEIYFDGHKWTRHDLHSIGALIESPPLYENLTARENLQVRTTVLGLPKSRIDEVLHVVELENTEKKKAKDFSNIRRADEWTGSFWNSGIKKTHSILSWKRNYGHFIESYFKRSKSNCRSCWDYIRWCIGVSGEIE